jgi:hypothetical protein
MLGEPWTFSAPRHSPGPQILLHICNGVGSHTEQNTMTQKKQTVTHTHTNPLIKRADAQVPDTSTPPEDDRQEEWTPQRARERSTYPSRREERRWKRKRKENKTKPDLQCLQKVFIPLNLFHILLRYSLNKKWTEHCYSSPIYTQYPIMTVKTCF